jgi:carboxypeptidase C (cathepsin A)
MDGYVECVHFGLYIHYFRLTQVTPIVLTAKDMHMFLLKWYEKFPDFKSRELFLTGESYAGMTICIEKSFIFALNLLSMQKFSRCTLLF